MKRVCSMVLAMTLVLSLFAGCSSSGSSTDATDTSDTTEASGTTGETKEAEATEEADPEAERYGGSFTLAWTPGDTLDPMKTSGWKSYAWAMNVYEGVLSKDVDGNICPGVCDFELSDDSLTLTLWVRDGVTFHDGTAVEIEDVLASIQRASQTVSRMKNHYVPYLESETIDGDKLIIKFTEYSIDTMYYFASDQTWNVVMPQEICEKYGADNAIVDVEDAIGTGPYMVTSFEAGVKVEMVRYEDYVAVPEGNTGMASAKKAYFDSITVVADSDDTVDLMKLLSGELDFKSPDTDAVEMYETDGVTVVPDVSNNAFYLMLNAAGNGAVSDVNLRKAIAAALDYEELMTYYAGDLSLVGSEYCSPITGAYTASAYGSADYHLEANVELAQSYLEASDYDGEEIIYVTSTALADLSPMIKERLSAVGINLTVEYMDDTALEEYILSTDNDWDICVQQSAIVEVPTTIAPNILTTSWDNERKDEILEELALYPVASEESIELWEELDQLMADDCPTIILGQAAAGYMAMNSDLVWQVDGTWRYWFNSYWTNPSEH